MKETYYTERANGRNEFWYYSDGKRHYCSEALVQRDVRRGIARLVKVKSATIARRNPKPGRKVSRAKKNPKPRKISRVKNLPARCPYCNTNDPSFYHLKLCEYRPEKIRRASTISRAKKNPIKRHWIIRGFASSTAIRDRWSDARGYSYFDGYTGFQKNRKLAYHYPSKLTAVSRAKQIQRQLPFAIEGIEIVQVGKS